MLEKMDKFEAPQSPGETMKFALPPAARGPELLVQLSDVTKAYGTNVVYRDLDFSVRRGDRLALLGPNGRGKSTLLKLVAGMTDYQAGVRRVGDNVFISYFAQFQLEELNPNHTVLEEIQAVAGHLTTGRLRTVLGNFLFHGDDVFKKVSVLSGGEKSRLILAKIMLAGPNLLLLDEPTNHLDIPGRDLLEQALRQYDGTLVLISHDRHLINAVANKVALIEPGGGVDTFLGDFEDFLRIWKDRLEQEAAASESKAVERAAAPSKSPGQSLTRAEKEAKKRAEAEARQRLYKQKAPLVKQVEQLEASQAELGIRLDRLSAELADPETYQEADRAKQLNQAYADTKTELERVTEAWEEAALKLEEIEDLEQSES
jgi:ATP-binding cassette subfamily F protein 3